MLNNYIRVRQKNPEVTEISTDWKNSKVHISPDGNWILSIGNKSKWWLTEEPLLTILHVPSSRQQELELKKWKQFVESNKAQRGIEIVEFAINQKTQMQYAIITYQGLKCYFCLKNPWIEEVSQDISDSLDLQTHDVMKQKLCRFIIEGNVVKVCHPTKVSAESFADIHHEAKVIEALVLHHDLVMTQDETFLVQLTRVNFSSLKQQQEVISTPLLDEIFDETEGVA